MNPYATGFLLGMLFIRVLYSLTSNEYQIAEAAWRAYLASGDAEDTEFIDWLRQGGTK